tara:strand:+ start:326 stop:565 length:240 start_codon:yes stop_codon:yes gene_type:complete
MKITRTIDLVSLQCPSLILKVKQELALTHNSKGWCLKVRGYTSLSSLKYFLQRSQYVFQVIDEAQGNFHVILLSKVKPE